MINYNRMLARWRLIRRYKYLTEVDKLLEEYTTRKILDGGSEEYVQTNRKQLINLQNDIKEYQRMLEFLKTNK